MTGCIRRKSNRSADIKIQNTKEALRNAWVPTARAAVIVIDYLLCDFDVRNVIDCYKVCVLVKNVKSDVRKFYF